MPFYLSVVRPGLLDAEQRQAFANDVVEVHCGVTGAPPSFVHVMYLDGDQLPDGRNALVRGTIRSGRTDEQKAEITSRLAAALAAHADVPVSTVDVTTADIGASYTMEGGVLLPEPGSPEEAEWKAAGAPG